MSIKTCKDCIGNKYCSEYEKYDEAYINSLSGIKDVSTLCRDFTDITDVVPRSEVEKSKQEVALQIINEFKNIVIEYVQEKDLLLVAFKNAVAHAEKELKKKYIGEATVNDKTR